MAYPRAPKLQDRLVHKWKYNISVGRLLVLGILVQIFDVHYKPLETSMCLECFVDHNVLFSATPWLVIYHVICLSNFARTVFLIVFKNNTTQTPSHWAFMKTSTKFIPLSWQRCWSVSPPPTMGQQPLFRKDSGIHDWSIQHTRLLAGCYKPWGQCQKCRKRSSVHNRLML